MRFVSLLFVGLFAVSVFVQLRTWRRQRRVRPGLIMVSQFAALASSVVFSAITRRPPSPGWWIILLGAGVAFGVVYGGLMVVDRTERGVVMGYTVPSIVIWSALMVITQLTTILGHSVPVVIYSLAIANLGVNLGMNGRVLSGYTTLRGAPAIGLLMVAALIVMPMLPARAQTGEPSRYAGTYEGSVLFPFGDVIGFDYTLVIDERGTVTGAGEEHSTAVPLEGPNTVSGGTWVWALRSVDLTLNCGGLVDGDGNVTCEGTFSHVTTLADPDDGTVFDEKSYGGFFTIALPIGPDGGGDGSFVSDYGTAPCTAQAVSGGPGAVPGDSVPVNTTVDTTPGGIPVVPTDSSVEVPLTDEQTALAVALSAFLLAGGALAQLLPLLEGGMSLQEALRRVAGPEEVLPAVVVVDALAGLSRTADGRVLFQPPWEVGGPVPMDPDQVRQVLDMQRRGYRWTGESGGWMTPDQEAMNAEWGARQRAADIVDRERFLAEQARARAELAEQRDALETVKKALEVVDRRSRVGVDRYEQLSDQIYAHAYNADGSVNVEYVGRMRDGLGRMLRRDLAIPDESLRSTMVSDFASSTWDDARHSGLIRIGAGVVSGGQSEWLYQSQGVLDAMDAASQQGDLTYADGLRIAYGTVAEENLPVTTIGKVLKGEEVGLLDVAGDLLKGVNVRTQAKGMIAEQVADGNGLVAWQRRSVQAESNASGVDITLRKVNAGASKAENMPGKLPWMKQKTITADDVELLGYPKSQLGQVPAGPPRPPTGFTNALEYREAMARYNNRAAEWAEHGATTREALAAGKVVEVDGVLHTVNPATGKPGLPFISDLDPADVMTAGGRRLTDAQAVAVMRRLEQRGVAVGGHGSPYTWDPVTDAGKELKAELIREIEGGKIGEKFVAGGTSGAPPRFTVETPLGEVHLGAHAGAGVHDIEKHGI